MRPAPSPPVGLTPQAAVPSASPAPIQQAFAPAPAPVPEPAPILRPAPVPFAPPSATEADILADAPERRAIYRFALQPAIVVLQFPNLAEQGRMLNRIAALIEKQGYPRDRVLSHEELNARIRASGLTPETFYYGHDYRAADIIRFFALASDLDPEELDLQELVLKLGWREHGSIGALISLVRETPNADIDNAARRTILRHELSHGVYFTDPAYVQCCYHFWNDVLTPQERVLFTAFLQREGYDPALTDLIVNETQAYLIHTHDRRFFRPVDVGLTEARADQLRRIFIADMPPGWLRDATLLPEPSQHIPVRAP
ncbi:MAG: hypothetical protein JOZ05_03135 [Acetobacteraceae bacterium]|nr:hypothetical protein [Acetobacteraceae bacterium]